MNYEFIIKRLLAGRACLCGVAKDRDEAWRILAADLKGIIEAMPNYPEETLGEDSDDGTMTGSREELADAVVGHRIVSVAKEEVKGTWYGRSEATVITLDNGKRVELLDTDDCCAYTKVESFLLHPDRVDHMIMGVGTTDGYDKWHIYADLGDVLELDVGWSPGNPFYYGYGFEIRVRDVE